MSNLIASKLSNLAAQALFEWSETYIGAAFEAMDANYWSEREIVGKCTRKL